MNKIEAAVIEIIDELSSDDLRELRELAKNLNRRGVPCCHGEWTAGGIVRAIVKRCHDHIARISTR